MNRRILEQIEIKYDPDNNLIVGAPEVTWVDYKLLLALEELANEVEELAKKLDKFMENKNE